jgi:hypothetical protein
MHMDNITCQVCGFSGKNITTHLKYKHGLTGSQYKAIYGEGPLIIMSEEAKQKLSDINKEKCKDPAYIKMLSDVQKNGASIFTKNYWLKKGFTDEEAIEKVRSVQSKNAEKFVAKGDWDNCSWMRPKYWINKGYTKKEAKEIISEKQSILSNRSSRFTGHVRTQESKDKISASMKKKIQKIGAGKWSSHFGTFSGRSKIEIEFYDYIKQNINKDVQGNVPIRDYIVDVLLGGKVVEFYGDFWHANPRMHHADDTLTGFCSAGREVRDIRKNDENRVKKLKEMGYDVLVIWEYDWHHSKEECIKKVKDYLL